MALNQDFSELKFGFIGAGITAEAIVFGLIRHSKVDPKRIYVLAKNTKRLKRFECNYDVFDEQECDLIFLCSYDTSLADIPLKRHKPLIVLSLVNGVSLDQIRASLKHCNRLELHRIVMTTTCAFGTGLGIIDVNPNDPNVCNPVIARLLSTFCQLDCLHEEYMDSAGALTNAMPFIYQLISDLADGAVSLGLNRQTALKLATKTVETGAQVVLTSGQYIDDLIYSCDSGNGSVSHGIDVLNKAKVGLRLSDGIKTFHKNGNQLKPKVLSLDSILDFKSNIISFL